MNKNTTIYQANPEVSCRVEGTEEGAFLYNPDTSSVLAINNTGLLLWRALAKPVSQADLVAHLQASFADAPVDQAAGDIEEFLQALLPRGFVGQVLADE